MYAIFQSELKRKNYNNIVNIAVLENREINLVMFTLNVNNEEIPCPVYRF